MNENNMRKMINFLRTLSPHRFDFRQHVMHFEPIKNDRKNVCGTVCCALGWIPEIYPEENLELRKYALGGHLVLTNKGQDTPTLWEDSFARNAARILGIPEQHILLLFYPIEQQTETPFIDGVISKPCAEQLKKAWKFPEHVVLNEGDALATDLADTLEQYMEAVLVSA